MLVRFTHIKNALIHITLTWPAVPSRPTSLTVPPSTYVHHCLKPIGYFLAPNPLPINRDLLHENVAKRRCTVDGRWRMDDRQWRTVMDVGPDVSQSHNKPLSLVKVKSWLFEHQLKIVCFRIYCEIIRQIKCKIFDHKKHELK